MKVGIRAKLVALLTAVALVPLLAALLAVGIGGRRVVVEAFGKMLLLAASAEALTLRTALTEDAQKLQVALQHEPSVVEALAGRDKALLPTELAALDANWQKMPLGAEPLAGILGHPIAAKLRRLQQQDPEFAEVFVTDRFGQLVAATRRTTDYYQADELWWQQAWNGGRGRVFIPPVSYDESADVWSVDLCIPILSGREVVGVAKAVLDVSQWVEFGRQVGERRASVMVVQQDGTIISRRDTTPLARRAAHWEGPIAEAKEPGWRTSRDGEVQGYAPIHLPRRLYNADVSGPLWVLVAYVPEEEVLGEVRWLSGVALAAGLAVIGGLFLAALTLVERSIVRRLLRLARATRRVREGDLEHRIQPRSAGRRLLGPDEIDDLARLQPNGGRIQQSHRELEEANQLKMDFIRVASHELRTPVGYILATARLLAGRDDVERLRKAIATMGTKAERLNQIIEQMFKLMPHQRYANPLRCVRVDVAKLLEGAYLDCLPFAEQRKQRLVVHVAEGCDSVRADPDKLHDILVNLVTNAIKFTPDGGTIAIDVSMELGSRLSIAVTDQGPGIPKSELPHIFGAFYSGGDVLKHSTGKAEYGKRGMGLGLAVVKHFAELHGGEARVSTSPKGSTFVVTIPTEPPVRTRRPGEPEGKLD